MIKKYLSVLTAVSLSLVAVTGAYSNAAEKEVTEVTTKRSEYRKVFNNGDGTYTAYTNTAPIHFLDNGEWTEIDNTLVDNGDGFYTNKNNSFSVSLPSELNISDTESSTVNLSYEKLNISCALTNIEIPSGFESQPAYIDVNNAVYDSAYDMDIPKELATAFSNSSAEADYRAISDGLDLNMSVHNSTFTESLVINDVDKIPESVTYSVSAEGVQLERAEDNSLLFVRDGEIVLEIPMFVMCDSSEELNEFIVNYDIFETETGYDVVLYPLSSIGDVGSVVMPASIGTDFTYEIDFSTTHISELSPTTSYINSRYIKIGSLINNKSHTFVSFQDFFEFYGRQAVIHDARLNMYVNNNVTANCVIKTYGLKNRYSSPTWNSSSSLNSNNVKVSDTSVSSGTASEWIDVDVTSLIQSWLNFVNTNNIVGIANNGFRMTLENGSNTEVRANSEGMSTNTPYFVVNFSVNTAPYKLEYSPHKYNDIIDTTTNGRIFNFQNRMNCYAYALQMYYNGDAYSSYLSPGRLSNPSSALNYDNISDAQEYLDYACGQMQNDFNVLGKNCVFISTDSFNLPNNFNDNSERIIAVTAGTNNNSFLGTIRKDVHFYLRHANRTCQSAGRNGHGINCSIWSHKPSLESVTNEVNNTILCDYNIADLGSSFVLTKGYVTNTYDEPLRFYRINQKTNVYNSSYHFEQNYPNGIVINN